MSVLEIRHEFVDVDARNLEQLYQTFCNQIHLGQWELAKTCLQILHQKRLQLNTNLEEFLTDIIRNPTAYCSGSNAVPTPFHLSLLLLEECRSKQYLDTKLIDSIQTDAIFHYLLAVGDIQPSAQVVQEFQRLHTNTTAIPSDLLTDSMADFLVDLWLHEIPRVHSLIRLYLHSNLPAVQLWLIQIHKRALEICFQQLKTLNNEQQRSILIDLLFSLHFYSCESNEFRLLFRDILKKIVIYASQPNQLFNLKALYECTLNNGYLARFLSELESEYRRELINNNTVILHFLKKNSFENEEFFWKEIYLYLIENKLDLISCVLNDSISLIENRDYSSLDQLLSIEQLSSLHLYIFLLAWTHVRTVNDAIVLYGLMDSLKNKSSTFEKCLKLFQSHTEFITWLYTVRRYHDGASPLPNMSDLLALLHTNSPLSLIHRYLDVPSIDSEEILEKLKKTAVDINDENEDQKKEVRWLDEPEGRLGSVRLPQTSSTMIFLGYLSINSVVEKLLSSNEITDDYFAQTKTYLEQIYPLRFRLELLENIFSLVLIQQSELKGEETIETLDQSTNTASERFLSSLQSHGTANDDTHTSTNPSIRTQVSIRRYDNDFEENTQDDLSIHSSSMSSVSLSHAQAISRTGFIITEDILYQLLCFLRDRLAEIRDLYQKIKAKATDKATVKLENSLDNCFLGCSISSSEQFTIRATKLNTIISETLWRYQLLTANKTTNDGQDNKLDGIDREQNLVDNPTIKNLILPISKHRHSNRGKRRSRLLSGSVGSVSSLAPNSPQANTPSPLVSQILSARDNLLAICLKEGKITEANEVIRLFNMQDHPLAVEAKFSKLFHDTVDQLSTSYSSSISLESNPTPSSPLAGLANLASSALGNTSLQNDITPLLELAQTQTVSSTLPSSAYFDHEYFLSLTLFDLAINAPTMTISKTLFDMSQHRLPMLRAIYSSTNTSSPRIKSLNEMISNYLQLTHASPNQSFEDIALDVTLPLDGIKATKTLQYYKRIDEHCRQYYINEQSSLPIEQQVKSTSELFENDSQAKIDLITYVRNQPYTNKQTSYINYFSIFHTYLQNFRLLLEKFPLNDMSSNLDLSKHSPLALVHRIVSRSSDIDLTQLQLLTSKLNIDISLAVSLNIIRPLFVDKTIASSSLSSTRRMTILQQQNEDTFYNRQQSFSILSGNLKKQVRRSATFLRRLTNRIDQYQHEPQTFDEHPEKFIRTLLIKLLDCIRKALGESIQSYLSVENIDKLFGLDEYEDILNTLPLLTFLDLDRLATTEERLCFFTNFYNFFLILSHLELIHSTTSAITPTNLFRNQLERLLFLITTRINLGQLKQLSLFDIRYYILQQTNPIDGLNFQFDKNNPMIQYAPVFKDYQRIQIGLVLNDCLTSSIPFVVLMPELIAEQLQRSTREFIQHCITIENNEGDNTIEISLPRFFEQLFASDDENLLYRFVGEYASNNQIIYAMNEQRLIKKNFYSIRNDFSINFDYHFYENQLNRKQARTRSNSLPSLSTTPISSTNSLEFLSSQSTVLPKHLIDARTIAFVQEKSPALGQILQIYVQSVVQNKPIENDNTSLNSYFQSLLLSPALLESTTSIAEEWFRSIVLNDLTYQHDLLLYLCSILWTNEKYLEIVQLFDSLLPSFIVHSIYCQILRDLALLNLIKLASEPDHAYQYLRKVRDCHLLVHATLTYLPRFDGPTCLKLLHLCLTSCKKSHQDYIPLLQERLNIMYVYKTLCLSALAQFNKCMEKISADENQMNMSIEDMAIKKTSSKCLTWQRAEEHSQIDPLAVATMFIYEKEFDMGHKWLNLLKNLIDDQTLNRVRLKLVEEHIHWLLKVENLENANKILLIIDLIENVNDKWHLCTELITDLSKNKLITYSKAIPFSRLFIKFRLIQYMLGHFDENFEHFQGEYDRSKLSILATGLALFFNCIPLEQTDSYVQLISQPLVILEQLLMNSSVDIAKTTIETMKILIEKYKLEKLIPIKQIDQLIEVYTKKSVQLNVRQTTDEQTNIENKSTQATSTTQRNNSQDISSSNRRQQSIGNSSLLTLRQRPSPKPSLSGPSTNDFDPNLSSSTSPSRQSPPIANSIPIKSQPQSTGSSSFKDYLSTSLSNQIPKTSPGGQHTVPMAAPSKKLWISDDEVSVCMCCKETQFSMFNRRHHCRRCGRVVCKSCSQHTTIIKDRLARTCNDCYYYLQQNPTPVQAPRQEQTPQTKKFENFRPTTKSITSFKRQSISQLYLDKNPGSDIKNSDLLFGTSLVNDTPQILEEDSFLYSASYSTASPLLKSKKSVLDSPQKQDSVETPTLPIVADEVQYQLTGTGSDDTIRNDFHYDQSPSITLCLSLIELHSNQYEGGKLLIKLCEYLSEQLSTRQRNTEIDYGLVLNIIKNLLFTAKMKLMAVVVSDDDEIVEQQKLIASCDLYNNLVDILSRLNMANCSLPALNDLLQQDTLRKIRNQLLDDERYQLAMDISTRCNLDTQSIWFQWGMAYLHIGQYLEARDRFDKCLLKNTDPSDAVAKQQQRGGVTQEKMLSDIVAYLETSLPLKYAMKWQYLAEQQIRQAGQTRASLKYLNSLSTIPRLPEQAEKVIQDEILFYLLTYSDDAHLLDYYIRREMYTQAFEHKCSLTLFRDHIYLPLLKRNHTKHLFNHILSRNNNAFTHHLRFVCTYLKEQELFHSLQQLQLFMNDFINAAFTSIKLFTANRTTYLDLFEKRLTHLQKALECFQHAKIDSEQTMAKVQSNKNRVELQIEITRYVHAQLLRLKINGSEELANCPTLFDPKDVVAKLILGLIAIADSITNAFNIVNKIIKELNMSANEIFIPCAEEIGKRRDYRSLQQLLQLVRDNGYTDVKLHDDIIEACVRESGSDVEQNREQDALIQLIKNDDTRIHVNIAVGKLRAAYLIAIRLGKEDKVRLIRDDAQKSGQTAVYDICKKWLENRASEQ